MNLVQQLYILGKLEQPGGQGGDAKIQKFMFFSKGCFDGASGFNFRNIHPYKLMIFVEQVWWKIKLAYLLPPDSEVPVNHNVVTLH